MNYIHSLLALYDPADKGGIKVWITNGRRSRIIGTRIRNFDLIPGCISGP